MSYSKSDNINIYIHLSDYGIVEAYLATDKIIDIKQEDFVPFLNISDIVSQVTALKTEQNKLKKQIEDIDKNIFDLCCGSID